MWYLDVDLFGLYYLDFTCFITVDPGTSVVGTRLIVASRGRRIYMYLREMTRNTTYSGHERRTYPLCAYSSTPQFPTLWLPTPRGALHGSSLPPLFRRSDTNLGLFPLPPTALDLRRTNGLSTQTPINVGVELVVVHERLRTQRTLAHGSGGGGHCRHRSGSRSGAVVRVLMLTGQAAARLPRDCVLPFRHGDCRSRGACPF